MIYFYPKDFTPGCTTEADEFSKDHAKFTKADIRIIGISPDDSEKHKKFCDKMGIKYTLLADTEKKVSKMFGVWGKKKFMGREYMGVARSTFLADKKGKIFKVFPKVKPAGHSKEVLECFYCKTSTCTTTCKSKGHTSKRILIFKIFYFLSCTYCTVYSKYFLQYNV